MRGLDAEGNGDLIVAADFGTSGVKLGLVDAEFRILGRVTIPYPLSLPGPGCAEQNPRDWWNALASGLRTLSHDVEGLSTRAAALVFCAQLCGLVCADGKGAPLRPAMIWLDKRSAALTRTLTGGFPSVQGYRLDKVLRWLLLANGAPSLTGMDPTGKMAWIARQEPETFRRSAKLLDVKDWLLHRATGRFCTTADSANLSWLMDTRAGREGWSSALADPLGIPLEKLPEIVDGRAIVGGLLPAAAADLCLPAGLPVVAGGGDVTATAIGSGAVADGALHICASTGGWISGFFPGRRLNPLSAYATVSSSVGYRPLLIAAQETAGSAFTWLAQVLEPGAATDNAALARLFADPGTPAADDPFFLPWLAGERVPADDHRLRGSFHGLNLGHDRKALLRAAVEGVAFNTRWAYDKVVRERGARKDGPVPLVGGAALNPFFAQTLADCLDRPVTVGDPLFGGVLGAAAIASCALRWTETVWAGAGTIAAQRSTLYEPNPARVAALGQRYQRLRILRDATVRLAKRSEGKIFRP